MLRIERQHALYPLQEVKPQHRNETEQQHRYRVFGPVHFTSRIDARESINQSLNRREHAIEKRALAVEHVGHKQPERLCHEQYQHEKEDDL